MPNDVDAALLIEDVLAGCARKPFGEGIFGFAYRFEWARAGRVELDSVARRDEEGLFVVFRRGRILCPELPLEIARRYGETLAHLHRRSAMRESDDHEVSHQALPPAALTA